MVGGIKMEWQKITNLEVGFKRFADGEWRFVEGELEDKIEARSNGKIDSFTITLTTLPKDYPTIAKDLITRMNSENLE